MKKIILLTAAAASLAAVTAFASSVPVTNIEQGQSKISAEYSFAQSVTNQGSGNDGFGVSLETGLTDRWALQYGYHKTNTDGGDIKDHQIAAVYKIHPNFNLYGAATHVDVGPSSWGFQGGVIGHTRLAERLDGFAKVGFGNDIKQTYQVGATYALTPDLGLNLYYGYDKYSVDRAEGSDKGLHVGLGYNF